MTGRAPQRLSTALLLVAGPVAAATAFRPGLLHGPAAMNGSARGTALVVLAGGIPAVLAGRRAARRGSPRGHALWLGGLAYLLYNAVMFCFATPFNALFLGYTAMLGLAGWSLGALAIATPAGSAPGVRMRGPSGYLAAVVALNTLAWLGRIVPELGHRAPAFLDGTGLTTNPVFVQDLAFWLPLMAIAAVLLWRGHPRGLLLGGAGLLFWQLEAIGVAVDQWLAHRADPASPVAGQGVVWLFVALFLVGAVPTAAVLRRLPAQDHRTHAPGSVASAPSTAAGIGWSRTPEQPAPQKESRK